MVDTAKLKKPMRGKGTPPPSAVAEAILEQPPSGEKVPLQLKISPELRREFKAYAVERDLQVSTLFASVWGFYKEHHG